MGSMSISRQGSLGCIQCEPPSRGRSALDEENWSELTLEVEVDLARSLLSKTARDWNRPRNLEVRIEQWSSFFFSWEVALASAWDCGKPLSLSNRTRASGLECNSRLRVAKSWEAEIPVLTKQKSSITLPNLNGSWWNGSLISNRAFACQLSNIARWKENYRPKDRRGWAASRFIGSVSHFSQKCCLELRRSVISPIFTLGYLKDLPSIRILPPNRTVNDGSPSMARSMASIYALRGKNPGNLEKVRLGRSWERSPFSLISSRASSWIQWGNGQFLKAVQ